MKPQKITIYALDGIVHHVDGLPPESDVETVEYFTEVTADGVNLYRNRGHLSPNNRSAGWRDEMAADYAFQKAERNKQGDAA